MEAGPISSIIPYRRFTREGFHVNSLVRDLVVACEDIWPEAWTMLNPIAFSHPLPTLTDADDVICWKGMQGDEVVFSVREACCSMVGTCPSVTWTKYVWFKGHIPKLSFCLWTACHGKLPTQDRIASWCSNQADLCCVFCNNCMDSHDHLFFDCIYSKDVWRRLKKEYDFYGFPERWSVIMVYLNDNRGPKKKSHRLALSSAVYHIWKERNRRLFQRITQPPIVLYNQIRDQIDLQVGDGISTNAWEDKWLSVGNLSSLIPYRLIRAAGFTKESTVSEVISSLDSNWPQAWVIRVPDLAELIVPQLNILEKDQVMWLDNNQTLTSFKVGEAWKTLVGDMEDAPWYGICWFKQYIPKYSFCLWLAILNRLPTQDRMLRWAPQSDQLLCSLCERSIDSRDHLFFDCHYSSSVWEKSRNEIGLDHYQGWEEILHNLIHHRWGSNAVRKKMFFAATVYFIWQERNRRLFDGRKRNPQQLFNELKASIHMKCLSIGSTMDVGESSRSTT
ncbi:hypothetical protein OSB04_un000420 [Centaurea solstitialis]|uniref:Reverse transcriptase zinc-binding domain-containing protein n=1 Tax=Centaurea solstitialis TaxID=347529 RepID=A0AA38VRX6_9ASTR|nr:hypothetical protein OSB04_un000420 [Centaurea solstitialis]